MNKNDFLTALAGQLPYKKDEVEFLFKIIADTLVNGLEKDGQVRTPIGVFKKVKRKARRIRSIHNGELTDLPEWEEIVFKANESLKQE